MNEQSLLNNGDCPNFIYFPGTDFVIKVGKLHVKTFTFSSYSNTNKIINLITDDES